MVPTNKMKRSRDGFVWDPEAWKENAKERRALEEGQNTIRETEYEQAVATWHLKLNMEKAFGHKAWMDNVVDPDTLQWTEKGDRVRPKAARTLNHLPTPQKRRL